MRVDTSFRLWAAVALLATLAAPPTALAQTYPNKPIRMIVPLPAGGIVDALARILANGYQQAWGQPGIVENKPGAGSIIGADIVARAEADGYTLLLGHIGTHGVNPSLYAKLPYDPVKDFAPIAGIVSVPTVLVTHPSVSANNVSELVALAKSRPGSLNASSAGNGTSSHMALAVLKQISGADITHIPYKGAPPALQAVLGGDVQVLFDTVFATAPHIKAGRLKALGVSVLQRLPLLPQVPTLNESGLPGFNISPWFALFAPAGTPAPVIEMIHAHTVKILGSTEIRKRLEAQGMLITPSSPAELRTFVNQEIARWAKVVRDVGIKPE
jgi:tripartite-type tricarboxylate transporter receptor subunit TctC